MFAALLASAAAMTSFDLGAQTPAAPAGPTAADIANKVQNFYNQTKTYKANFKQEYFIKMHNNSQTSEGQVAFEKPGKMSWKRISRTAPAWYRTGKSSRSTSPRCSR